MVNPFQLIGILLVIFISSIYFFGIPESVIISTLDVLLIYLLSSIDGIILFVMNILYFELFFPAYFSITVYALTKLTISEATS